MDSLINLEALKITNSVNFNKLKNSNILITGASGLVGLFFISSLKSIQPKLNIKITAWVNKEISPNIKNLFKDCTIIQGDITDVSNFNNLSKFDFIIHSAGYGQPLKFVKNKIKTIQINTEATTNLFKLLKKTGSFLFLSSSEVYNGLETMNITEDKMGCTNSDHFRSCYIEGKKCGESICFAFAQEGFDVKIARLSLAYGPGTQLDDERVINTFIKKGLKNDYIQLLDGGTSIRTYCYITDAVEMMWNIFLYGKNIIYNVGGISTISIYDLAENIGKILNKPIKLPETSIPLEGNPKIVNISCERYIKEFNKLYFINLKYGLEKTIEWYKLLE